jgi:RNA polymerase sigma-70 factor (ECF subfamily)
MNAVKNARTDARGRVQKEDAQPAASGLWAVLAREQVRLRRVAAGMGLAGADIDDVLQDVSVQVLRHTGRFEQESQMTAWLIRTTANECLMDHRRRFRRRATRIVEHRPELQRDTSENTTADRAAASEEIELVRRALAELDPALLEPLVLRYFAGLDSTEIGAALGLNASTVRSRLREARLALAGRLMQRGVEP